MEKGNLEMLYFLLWKEYKIAIRRDHDSDGCRYAQDGMPKIGEKEMRRRISILYDILYRPGRCLNIFAQEEFKVIYTGQGEEYFSYGKSNGDNRMCPRIGEIYTVQEITPYEAYAVVKLKKFPEQIFEASSFINYDNTVKSEDELLKEYGPELDGDIKRIEEIQEEIDNMPKLNDIEQLQELYEEYRDSKCIDALEEMVCFIDFVKGVTDFKIGDSFYDGSRRIIIVNISDGKNSSGHLVYFCKIIEDKDNLVWYMSFDQEEMEVIKITDVNLSEAELSEKELLIRKIMFETGGIMWGFACSENCEKDEPAPEKRYSIGDCIENEGKSRMEILDISETPDCYNSWIYFYRETKLDSKNKNCCEYDILVDNYIDIQ